MAAQRDLFSAASAEPVPGLRLSARLIDAGKASDLVRLIDGSDLTPFRFQQWTGKRLTRSFGWHYDFAGGGLTRAEPLPDWLSAIRDRVAGAFGDDPARYEQALVIRYDPGAGIGWHRDRPQFGEVIGLSLGAEVDLRLRRRTGRGFARATVPLIPCHAYRFVGEARHDWEHSIVPVERTRWSITFRSLAA